MVGVVYPPYIYSRVVFTQLVAVEEREGVRERVRGLRWVWRRVVTCSSGDIELRSVISVGCGSVGLQGREQLARRHSHMIP